MVHRDIKTDSILMIDTEHDDLCKLSMSGSAIKMVDADAEDRKRLHGSQGFMAPEVVAASTQQHMLEKADVWSLGCVLFTMSVCLRIDSYRAQCCVAGCPDSPRSR